MKKSAIILLSAFILLTFTACSGKEQAGDKWETEETQVKEGHTSMDDNKQEDIDLNTENLQDTEDTSEISSIDNTVAAEAAPDNKTEKNEASEMQNPETTATISDTVPAKYTTRRKDHCGTIENISYQTYDYFGDQSEITKYAYVYLPYEYDKNKLYNVMYLMHGIGGNEREWGMYDDSSKVKIMMDNLICYGDIEPFIIVVPNGRSSVNYANTSSDHNSFYLFGKELRNDLIPYIESTYATYGKYTEEGYDMTTNRDHRAMAGLSMGGMQTINIGMCESLDIISYFGAFSACPTTYTASKIATSLSEYADFNINYFYNICGTEDSIALASSLGATNSLTSLTDKLVDGENYMKQEVSGGHDFNVWYLGFYNNAQLVFKEKSLNNTSDKSIKSYIEDANLEVPKDFWDKKANVNYGEVKNIEYYSTATNSTRKAKVILPEGYTNKNKYPVIYLLHGIGGNEASLYDDNVQIVIGNAVASKAAEKMIVVLPNACANKTGTPPKDANGKELFFSVEHYQAYDNFLNDFKDCLMPYINQNFSVATGRENTAIAGFSMGGRVALHIGFSMPESIRYIAGLCPAPGILEYENYGVHENGLFTKQSFTLSEKYKNDTLVLIAKGKKDDIVREFPLTYHNALKANNVAHIYYETMGGINNKGNGGHGGDVYKHGLYNFLTSIFHN